jgi:hypothetical protein
MPSAAFTVRVAPADAKDPLPRDDAQPRRFILTRLTEKQEASHPDCVRVPFVEKADVTGSTAPSCFLQVWELDHFDEGAALQRMEAEGGDNQCLVVIPGVVARTAKGGKATFEFLATGDAESIPDQAKNTEVGRLLFQVDRPDARASPITVYVGRYEGFYELAAVLRSTSGDRSYGACDNAVPHIVRNVAGSVWHQLKNRGGFAIAFVSDYAAGNSNNAEFANQAEEMLATLPALRLQGDTLTVGFHRITHFNQMADSMRNVAQAVQRFMSDRFQVSVEAKVAVLKIYAHGTIKATNTNPTSWNSGSGTLRTTDVATFVSQIRDLVTDDVVVSLFACSNGRSPSADDLSVPQKQRKFGDKMFGRPYPCEEIGGDSLAWWLHRELVRQGKLWATVYGHTTAGHTTRNHFLRVFSRWGSADIPNLLGQARRMPQARLAGYKRETTWSGSKGETFRRRLRNANRLRTLSTISGKYYSYGWVGGSDAPTEGQSQRSAEIAAIEDDSASPLASLVNASQDTIPDQLVYEAPDRAYIRGLVDGNDDADLSENFTYQGIASTTTPFRLSVQLMKYVQMLRYRVDKPMTPVGVAEDGNRLIVRVAAAHAAPVLAAAQQMVQEGLLTAASRRGNNLDLDLEKPCTCAASKDNFPYAATTFALLTSIKDLVLAYAQQYDVPPVAVAGAIADEYNTQTGMKGAFDWLQDNVLLNFIPNFAIEFDAFVGSGSKLLNATKHDIGIGNVKLETAKQLYDLYPGAFAQKNWGYSDLVDYLRTDEGTVHIASLVIVRGRQLFDPYLTLYSNKRREAVYVTYYKQGPAYLQRYQDALARDPNHLLIPGEGCRVCRQRDKILQALGL